MIIYELHTVLFPSFSSISNKAQYLPVRLWVNITGFSVISTHIPLVVWIQNWLQKLFMYLFYRLVPFCKKCAQFKGWFCTKVLPYPKLANSLERPWPFDLWLTPETNWLQLIDCKWMYRSLATFWYKILYCRPSMRGAMAILVTHTARFLGKWKSQNLNFKG